MTISGWGARLACNKVIADNRAMYLREEPPAGNVLCEARTGGRHYIVRDQGALMVVGRLLCAAVIEQTHGQP